MTNTCRFLILLCLSFIVAPSAVAKDKEKGAGPPPMLVTTTKVTQGTAEPMANFIGTVYFSRTAEVAAEVGGIVEKVFVEDGEHVKAGAPLARLDDDLLATEIKGTRALHEQNLIDVKQAETDYQRIANLHEQEAIATSEYEAYATRLNRLRKQSTVLKARLDRQLLEQKKKTVRAPFDCLVIETLTEVGEWVKAGGVVAAVADNRSFEAHIDVPAHIIPHLTPRQQFTLSVSGQQGRGAFMNVIPRGDLSTRTFVAKFHIQQIDRLIEGMEVKASLPIGAASESLLVPRDAVINSYGSTVVFINNAGLAKMVPVEVVGYDGDMAGVRGESLQTDQDVVVKGSERIRDGQAIRTE